MKDNRLVEIQELIKSKIPITESLDFDLKSWNGDELVLHAPFLKNKNHHETVFGGSLAMSAIVSGYCMTFMALEDSLGKDWSDDHTLVIKDFSCKYLRPVSTDISTSSKAATGENVTDFSNCLLRKGKARLQVETFIEDCERRLACIATYVAFKKV